MVVRHGFLLALVVTVALVAGFGRDAQAGASPENTFAGKVLLSKKKFPTTSKSASAYIAQLKKQSESNFYEDKDTGCWKIYIAAFFKKPLNDLEVTIKLYDITNGGQEFIAAFEQYLDERGQRSVISSMKLAKTDVGVNKYVLVTVENNGRVLASGKMKILGEGEHYSGQVDFSDEDTQGNDE